MSENKPNNKLFDLAHYPIDNEFAEEEESDSEFEGGGKKKKRRLVNDNAVWDVHGPVYRQGHESPKVKLLPVAIYELMIIPVGFVLQRKYDEFTFPYKIYGNETTLVTRIQKTYKNTKGNLGVLFNGTKGTGKTVTAKQVCNSMKLPVILISQNISGCHAFVNSINQDIVIFIDEYEKIFVHKNDDDNTDILTIMDGALNSHHRRMFMLTTNNLYINENLKQRPGRVRYLKTFRDLHISVTEEIVDDLLIHKHLKKDVMQFIASLEIITIDIVKSVLQEVNIHEESPNNFADIFNVQKLTGKFNIYLMDKENKEIPLYMSIVTNFRSYDSFDTTERSFSLNISGVGYISLEKAITFETFEATIDVNNQIYEKSQPFILEKLTQIGKKIKKKNYIEKVILKIETASMYNVFYKKSSSFHEYMDL